MNAETKPVRKISGRVTSVKMDKTVRIELTRLVAHPVYGKYIRRSSTVLAHDENNECNEGDVVVIRACRPISKNKVWVLDQILDRSA